jgi:uncharacterized membrane protein
MKKLFNYLIWPVMAVPAVYLALGWKKIPENVAMHFDIRGNADRFGSRNELLLTALLLTGMNILVYLAISNMYRIDPKKYAADNKDRLRRIAAGVAVFMAAITCLIIHSSIAGKMKFDVSLVLAGVGLLFAFIGNYMPNLKPNYFAGLRLPWTLENPDNWKKTHFLAGKLWFAGGLLIAVVCLFLPPVAAMIVFFTVMCIITLVPCVYSYRLYKQNKAHSVNE